MGSLSVPLPPSLAATVPSISVLKNFDLFPRSTSITARGTNPSKDTNIANDLTNDLTNDLAKQKRDRLLAVSLIT